MSSRVLASCVVLLAAACGGEPTASVEIPLPDLARLEPQVADKIRAARAAVAARGDGDAWRHLGRVLLAHHEWPGAERALAVAGELPGEQRAESLYLAGCAADLSGAPYETALAYIERALAIRDDYAPARLRCGQLALDAGRVDDAERHYRRALRLERSSHALLGLGRVALRRGDPEAALAWLQQAHEADATHAEVTVTLARTLDELGRSAEARRFERRVPSRHPRRFFRDPVMLRALAETVSYLGLIEQADRAVAAGYPRDAVAFLDRAIRANATSADARVRKGRVLASMRRYDDAIAEYRRALALAPTFGLARGLEGGCLAALGRAEEAERALREGVAIDPANTETRHLLADYLAGRGETAEATEILVQILREAPDQVPSRLLLARLLLRSGDREGAREHVDAALREAPFDRSAIALAGRIGR